MRSIIISEFPSTILWLIDFACKFGIHVLYARVDGIKGATGKLWPGTCSGVDSSGNHWIHLVGYHFLIVSFLSPAIYHR